MPGAVLGEVSDLKELPLVTFTKSPEGSSLLYPTRLSSPRPPFPITKGTERHREDSACRSPPAVITTTRVGLWVPAGLTESLLPAGARREPAEGSDQGWLSLLPVKKPSPHSGLEGTCHPMPALVAGWPGYLPSWQWGSCPTFDHRAKIMGSLSVSGHTQQAELPPPTEAGRASGDGG